MIGVADATKADVGGTVGTVEVDVKLLIDVGSSCKRAKALGRRTGSFWERYAGRSKLWRATGLKC